jgi:hypothetical protein
MERIQTTALQGFREDDIGCNTTIITFIFLKHLLVCFV